ncbi:hypothetical protein PTSG_09496 [Salpingoeca rosetta]|uniref:SYO1-like TPR repeats domain-containing protein n=1 Tax=Salpingoeca rosetta (strain ATCC 50818 / BSB-021) TaxID=946362 RepID=F2UL63_SALR5|nr:uncharacterized protein PTSG_09496 [Salpingoeca rosetta]EGD77862.1 hypothetical protein PTSG_09496 [Salpingoeca rosetta]|eukprot:XP_004989926.1 hypothetical protein PTSG_09496 [Salpingoeca rosetta]
MPRHRRNNKGKKKKGGGKASSQQQQQQQQQQQRRDQEQQKAGQKNNADAVKNAVAPLLVQLADEAAAARHLACNSLAHITADPAAHAPLLEMGIVEPLRAALNDSENLPVQAEAAGCFRNLATSSDDSILGHVFDDATQHTLSTVFAKRVSEIEQTVAEADDEHKLHFFDVLEQLCKIFSLLCETNPMMVEAITAAPDMLANMVACMRPSLLPLPLCINAASSLLVISEDNAAFSEWLVGNTQAQQHLVSLVAATATEPFTAELRLSAAGVLANARATDNEETLGAVVACAGTVLDEDTRAALTALVPVLPQARQAEQNNFVADESVQLAAVKSNIRAQRLALEILTNMLCLSSPDEEWTVIDEDADDDDAAMAMMEEEEQQQHGSMDAEAAARMEMLFAHMDQHAIFSKVLARCQPLDATTHSCFTKLGDWGQLQLNQFHMLLQAAVNMINNITSAGERGVRCFGDLGALWLACFSLFQHSNKDIVQSATTAAWSVLRTALTSDEIRQGMQIPREHLEIVFLVASDSSSPEEARTACVGVLACVSQLPANKQDLVDLGKAIAHAAATDPSPWVRMEAINGVFDAFAEADVNQEYIASGLAETVPKLLANTRVERGMPPDLKARVSETRLNLKRFIEYKNAQ